MVVGEMIVVELFVVEHVCTLVDKRLMCSMIYIALYYCLYHEEYFSHLAFSSADEI